MSNTVKYIIFFSLCFLQKRSFAQVDLQKGLLACFSFEGSARDLTGNGHDGITENADLVSDRCGKAKAAYQFNSDAEIELQNPASLATTYYSYALWAKSTRNPKTGEVLILYSIGSPGGDQNISNSNNSALNGACIGWAGWGYNTTNNGDVSCLNTLGSTPTLNQWYHTVFTRDNHDKKLYVDGKLINAAPSHDDAFYGIGTLKAKIGNRNANGTQNYFNGIIDDLRIYNRVLNADEVKALYNQQCQLVDIISPSTSCSNQNIVFVAKGIAKSYSPTYQWQVNGQLVGSNDSTLNYNFLPRLSSYSAQLAVVVNYQLGCSETFQTSDEITIVLKDCSTTPVYIPTIFTPNGDGLNDTWQLFNVTSVLEVVIYNRWGELVFHSNGYGTAWDGTYEGSPLSTGLYAYKIQLVDGFVHTGSVMLTR
ncbi:LamG-like jellyroll fold domain-containing protein [Spirosoma pollinicola]|uniref:LamG-like jellyroll fold domain-containing protein n=1 Tax=Spirosoma pollinicola TaxID=2057025 RepID=A0A2K8YTW8_9BACT|nr:LamG-like jellyroll fold domain-containing protein [Spirosoma pollinicola]AUD00998.1 hypothetical protein CWM47_03675 [Spirosoma pollinicola]